MTPELATTNASYKSPQVKAWGTSFTELSKNMKWFRFYHEFVDDPKIAMMSDSDQLLWVKALCLASDNANRGLIELTDEEICWKLRISVESWRHAIDKFRAKGMIEHCRTGYRITNWNKRQFSSDSSAERVALYRRRQKEEAENLDTASELDCEAEQNQACNVTVTTPEQSITKQSKSKTNTNQSIDSTIVESVSEGDEPVELVKRENPKSVSQMDEFVDLYNEHRPDTWASCRRVNPKAKTSKRPKSIRGMIFDCEANGDSWRDVLRVALAMAKLDPFMSREYRNGSIDALFITFKNSTVPNWQRLYEMGVNRNLNPDAVHGSGLTVAQIDQAKKAAERQSQPSLAELERMRQEYLAKKRQEA